MLTDILGRIPDRAYRWLLRRLGIEVGVHAMCPGWCPCDDFGGHE